MGQLSEKIDKEKTLTKLLQESSDPIEEGPDKWKHEKALLGYGKKYGMKAAEYLPGAPGLMSRVYNRPTETLDALTEVAKGVPVYGIGVRYIDSKIDD